jgi:hypothetical protein
MIGAGGCLVETAHHPLPVRIRYVARDGPNVAPVRKLKAPRVIMIRCKSMPVFDDR